MKKTRTLILLLLLNVAVIPNLFSQISVNATGVLPDTSAMLDIASTNKGFLLPRMSTVQRDDSIKLPATGLAIFNTTTSTIDINIGTPVSPDWSPLSVQGLTDTSTITNFYVKVRSLFSATAPIIYSNGLISITQATTSANGYLSSTDWTTFNTKGSGTVSNIATGYGLSGGAITTTGTIIVDSAVLSLKYLRIVDTATMLNNYRAAINTNTSGIATNATAITTKLNITDTTNMRLRPIAGTNVTITGTYPNLTFNASAPGGGVTSIATTSPITGGTITTTGTIGITQADVSTNGYLSSTDWNTFNSKGSGTLTGVTGTTNRITSTGGTTPAIDISSSYVGQTSITTLGTIATGIWSGTTIAVTKGGTGLTATAQGDIFYSSAANTIARLPKSTTSTRYLSNTGGSNNPLWAQVNLSNGVSGDLNVANLDGGSSATISTFWRGDGRWAPANQMPIALETVDYTPTDADYTIECDNIAPMSVNLPPAATISGRVYVIKKISGASLDVTVTPNLTETIDGAPGQTLSTQYSRITIQSDGTNWIILSN